MSKRGVIRGWLVLAAVAFLGVACDEIWSFEGADLRTDGQPADAGGDSAPDIGADAAADLAADQAPVDHGSDLPSCAPPIARFSASVSGDCPGNVLMLDASASLAGGCAAAIETMHWIVTRPDGVGLLQGFGAPTDPVALGGAPSGTYLAPLVSLGALQGRQAAHLQHFGGANIQLYQNGFSFEPKANHELALTVRADRSTTLRRIFVHQHNEPNMGYGLDERDVPVGEAWSTLRYPFTTNDLLAGVPTKDARVQVQLGGPPGTKFWFAEVALVRLASSVQLLDDPRFELPAGASRWRSHFESGGIYEIQPVPSVLAGDYVAVLEVTNDRDEVSAVASMAVAVSACP